MALWLRDLSLDLSEDENLLPGLVAGALGVDSAALLTFKIIRRSLDARKKTRLRRVYTVEFTVADEDVLLGRHCDNSHLERAVTPPDTTLLKLAPGHRVLVVGMGPAGLFAAKSLVEAGANVTLIERGRPVEQRVKDVEKFWLTGELDPISNVQFGEGGAGTFSDGKLTTRLKHPLRSTVLETLVTFGAPDNILVEAHPHVGTDRLRKVVLAFRNYLSELGVDLKFETCLTDLETRQGRVVAGVLNGHDLVPCEALVLAPGHSARDTYAMLERKGVHLDAKSFAVGVRVEHPAKLINRIQYGNVPVELPAADYALRYNDLESGRGVYSFCMCPGGEVINAASESDGLVVNGMSKTMRASEFSNSALVVSVNPDDWGGDSLGGVAFQRHWEQQAFAAGGGGFMVPAQNLMTFLDGSRGPVMSTCRPGVVEADLSLALPDFVTQCLRRALPHFNRRMQGFLTSEAVLTGVETRTSAPVRITRNDQGESVSHQGLFPAGEGAGYAGGIMSAALDGLRAAEQVHSVLIQT